MNPKEYIRYSGMAIQMGVIILLGVLAGRWLDGQVVWKVPVFTIVMALLSIAAALYYFLKDIIGKK